MTSPVAVDAAGPVVTVQLHAAAREAAGVAVLTLPADAVGDLDRLRSTLADRHGEPLQRVLAIATLLVDGRAHPPGASAPLPAGATVEVLPPFAGG